MPTATDHLQKNYKAMAAELVRRLAGVAETEMRTKVLGERLSAMGVVQAIWTIEAIIRGALLKEAAFVATYDCLLDPAGLTEILGDARMNEMLEAGVDEGCVAALQWLRGPTLVVEKTDALPEKKQTERLVDRELRELTLGSRRALARRARGDLLARVLTDPDPGVITNLLTNPRTTEQVVLAIASRRPTVSEPLIAVLRSPRWICRYQVKLALVQNPHLDVERGLNLLVYLNRGHLEEVRDDDNLSGTLRLGAQRLLSILAGGC